MENTKFVIILDHSKAKGALSVDELKSVLQFLEESDVLTETFRGMAEGVGDTPRHQVCAAETPDFSGLADTLIELADAAEGYRDKLGAFIKEADELLETLGDFDAGWDDGE